jgi:predicted metal-dependent enzyme (double-stranded beta helix superfamily)
MAATKTASGVTELARSIRAVTRRGLAPAATAELVRAALEAQLGRDDLLAPEHTEGDPECYRSHILHVEPDGSFSTVALVWLPGQVTPVHDHVSWCVVGVYRGDEEEIRYRMESSAGAPCLVPTGRSANRQGTTSCLTPPGDIHLVRNASAGKVISIHVYGADIGRLGSSIRRRYDLPIQGTASS